MLPNFLKISSYLLSLSLNKINFSTNSLLNGKENLSGYIHYVCIFMSILIEKKFHHFSVPLNHLINSILLFGLYMVFMSVQKWTKSLVFSSLYMMIGWFMTMKYIQRFELIIILELRWTFLTIAAIIDYIQHL